MKKYYMNKLNKEMVIYSHTNDMNGVVYFKNLNGEEFSSEASYWKEKYINLTKSVEKLEKVVKTDGDYTTPDLPKLNSDDRRNLLFLINHLIKE